VKFLILSMLNGISFGAVLFLLASGLSLTLGLMGILNLAHGALYMVAAYIGWTVTVQFGLNYFLAVLAGGLVAGLLGLAIERGFLRHLYRQINDQVLVTTGFIYILSYRYYTCRVGIGCCDVVGTGKNSDRRYRSSRNGR
jgi:branched-chain amino acid transport system permease protein